MTPIQLNAELLRNMSIIAEDEGLLRRAARYLRKLVAEKEDSTLLTKKQFFANIAEAEEQARQGRVRTFADVNELDHFIRGE